MSHPTPRREASESRLRRLLFTPGDGRLRTGWRLLLHALASVFLYVLFGLIQFSAAVMFGFLDPNAVQVQLIESPYFFLAPAAAITLATWGARRWLDRRPFRDLGFIVDHHAWRDLAFGVLMPGALFGAIFLVQWAVGWLELRGTALDGGAAFPALLALLDWFVIFILVGYAEELLSRGYHLQTFIEGLNLPLGIFLSSAVFAVLHVFNPHSSVLSTLGILLAGYFLAYGWLRTGQLWLPIGLHIGWNFFQGPIFGFPVSGLDAFHLLQHEVAGPQLITGGRFGPEAGLLGYLAMGIGALLIWSYTRDRNGPFDPPNGRQTDRRPNQSETQVVNAAQRPDG